MSGTPSEGGGGGEYVGPLDIAADALFAFGQRAVSADWLGQAAYTLREGGGNTSQTFSYDAISGEFPTSAATTFLNSANGFVSEWKDQSGNGIDIALADVESQPPWTAVSNGGIPSIGDGGDYLASGANTFTLPGGALTLFIVAKRGRIKAETEDEAMYIDFRNGSVAQIDMYDGANEAGGDYSNVLLDDEQFYLYEVAWTTGQHVFLYNGTALIEQSSYDSGPSASLTEPLELYIEMRGVQEVIGYGRLLDAPTRALIRQNIADFYGFTLP